MKTMQLATLKTIADGLADLGRPGHDTPAQARQRLHLMQQFETLLRSASSQDRHFISQTLLEMLKDCR